MIKVTVLNETNDPAGARKVRGSRNELVLKQSNTDHA